MKRLFTFLIIITYFSVTNFVFCQAPVSCGPAPLSSAYIPYSNNTVDYNCFFCPVFVYDGSGYPSMQLAAQSLKSCNLRPKGSLVTFAVFPGALAEDNTWRHEKIYVNEQGGAPWNIWSVDTTTGVRTVVCTMSGITLNNATGITWDPTHQQMYGVNTTLSTSQIFSIDMSTGVCTWIGSPSTICAGAISISSSQTGSLFCIDIVNDNLYKVNRTTGVFTLVGALGYDANYGQDAQFNYGYGKLYWASCGGAVQLRIVDTTNGTNTAICSYLSNQICCIAIFDNMVAIKNNTTISNVNLYPNPAQDKITINLQGLQDLAGLNLQIYNIQGQLLIQQALQQDNTEIDITQLMQGVYVAKIKLGDGSIVQKKFIVIK